MPKQQLTKPLDPRSKQVIKDTMLEFFEKTLFDHIFTKMVYWYTPFENVNSTEWSVLEIGTGGAIAGSGNGEGIELSTGTSSGDAIGVSKVVHRGNSAVYRKRTKFFAAFQVPAVTSQEAYINLGQSDSAGASAGEAFGFKIATATLQGIVNDGTTETTVDLLTISADTVYNLEAKYIPNDSVVFSVDGVERGRLTTELPSKSATTDLLLDMAVKTATTASRIVKIHYAGFLQRK